jgi:hypothetical protein
MLAPPSHHVPPNVEQLLRAQPINPYGKLRFEVLSRRPGASPQCDSENESHALGASPQLGEARRQVEDLDLLAIEGLYAHTE